jgi:hypothetical protein
MGKMKPLLVKSLIFVIFCSMISISCKGDGEERSFSNENGSLNLVKIDSVKVPFLGNPTVHDISPSQEVVLFVDHQESSEIIHVVDFEGNKLNSFSKIEDIPDSYGSLRATLLIQEDSTFLAFGTNGFISYNFSGQTVSKQKLKNFQPPNSFVIGMGNGLKKYKGKFLFANLGEGIESIPDIKPFAWLDPTSGEKVTFSKIPTSTLFHNGKNFFKNAWNPVFDIHQEYIYVVFGIEPTLFIISAVNPDKILNSFPLSLPNYRYFKGSDRNRSDPRLFGQVQTSGKITNIEIYKGYFLISYFPGYDLADTEERFENKSTTESIEFRKRMENKYANRLAVFDSLGNFVKDFTPEKNGLLGGSMIVRDNQLWMVEMPNDQIEQDYFRLFRVDLLTN